MAEQHGVTVQSLVHWALSVNDLEEARRFYTEVFYGYIKAGQRAEEALRPGALRTPGRLS